MAVIIEVVNTEHFLDESTGAVVAVEVVKGTEVPVSTNVVAEAVVNVVQPGGTVVNVQWGYEFPPAPYEGQIFLKVTE